VLRSVSAELARSTGTNPLYLMVPATVTCRQSGQISPNNYIYLLSNIIAIAKLFFGDVLNQFSA
jgi:hypothetical protein